MNRFPQEFENIYIPRASNDRIDSSQTGSYKNRKYQLVRAPHNIYDKNECVFKHVGLLRVSFNHTNNEPPQYGTAVIVKTKAGYLYLLTAAHNIVNWNVQSQTFDYATKIWFELRENNHPFKFWDVSCMKKRFAVNATNVRVHPKYLELNNPAFDCGYDIAVIKCGYLLVDNKYIQFAGKRSTIRTVHKLQQILETIFSFRDNKQMGCEFTIADEKYDTGSIIGFPVDHKSEMYGKNGVFEETKSDEILIYKIPTCKGQSGSPIFYQNMNSEIAAANPFINLSSIIGIHTGGDQEHNSGTKITREKYEWIHDMITELSENDERYPDKVMFEKDLKKSTVYWLCWNGMRWSMDVEIITKNILNVSQSKRAEAYAKYMYYTKKLESID